MLTDGGLRLTDTYPLYLEKGVPRFPMSDEHKWGLYLRESEDNPAILPDLTDPATLGCLLALVREAWGVPELSVYYDGEGGNLSPPSRWMVSLSWGVTDWAGCVTKGHFTEAEALVAALEAAP
jgi:hypothetical protein